MIEWILGTAALGLLGSAFGKKQEAKKPTWNQPTPPIFAGDAWTDERLHALAQDLKRLTDSDFYPACSALPLLVEEASIDVKNLAARVIRMGPPFHADQLNAPLIAFAKDWSCRVFVPLQVLV